MICHSDVGRIFQDTSLHYRFAPHGFPLPQKKPPSINQAVTWIARLGGFLARRHDGFPGVKTLWRG